MKGIQLIKNLTYKLQLEKLVVGVEEPIFIKGIGDVLAKVDSGNGAYNVIHGEDFYYQGNIVTFTTYDDNDRPHKVSKKIQDTITINIGAGHTEERPIILLDVKFANDEYTNVPFSVGNRTNNKNKILLGKDFLTKELNALIDISSDNIADKNIQVDLPVIESNADSGSNNIIGSKPTQNNPSGSTSTLGKAYQGIKGGIRGAYNIYKTLGTTDKTIGGTIDSLKKNWAEMMTEIKDYQHSDKYLIFKALNEEFMASGQPIKPFVNDPQIYKILDYLGNNYSNKNLGETDKNGNPTSNDQQSANSNINGSENSKIPSLPENSKVNSPVTDKLTVPTNSSVENQGDNLVNEADESFDKVTKELAKIDKPILYLVLFDGKQADKAKEILTTNYPQYNGDLYTIMRDIKADFYTETTKLLAKNIVKDLKEANILSNFALVKGSKNNRKVTFLASAFEPSYFISFLNQYTKDYTEELLLGFDGEPNNEVKIGRFLDNPLFGFNSYKKGATMAIAGLPDEQIKQWIFDKNAHKGYNVEAAFNKFMGRPNKSENNSSNNSDDSDSQDSSNNSEDSSDNNDQNFSDFSETETNSSETDSKKSKFNADKEKYKKLDNTNDSNKSEKPENPKPENPSPKPKTKHYSVPKGYKPPKGGKWLKNGHYLWKDKDGTYYEYVPYDNMVYDALEWRRERAKNKSEENEENILEWTVSKFILDCLL